MSVTEKDESSEYHESSFHLRDTDIIANRTSVSNVQIRALDKVVPTVQSDSLPKKTEDNLKTVAPRGLTHLDLAADSVSLSTEPSSGFMLISVKHLSKVKRVKYRSRSTSSLSTRTINDNRRMTDVNTIGSSSRDDSSPTTSSPIGEDENQHNFHGSGSIEAEEFDDDEMDEEEGTNEDDNTTVVVNTSGDLANKIVVLENPFGSLKENQMFDMNRSQVCSSTQTVSRPETPLDNRDARSSNFVLQPNYRLSPKVPQTLPSGFSLSTCDRHFEWFSHHPQDTHFMINPCEVFQYNSLVPTHETTSFLPSFLTPHIQTNSSHYQSEVGACSPAQNPVQTAPVSGNVSPPPITTVQSTTDSHFISVPPESSRHCPARPYPSVASMLYDPSLSVMVEGMVIPVGCMSSSSGLSVHPTTVPKWPNHQPGGVDQPIAHSPFDLPLSSSINTQQQHHVYAPGLPITCPLHPHSSSVSDARSSQMITKTESNSLAAEVVAISTASLPSLQPASRFRKARIHETVEQWNHGRVSVHDCHLKAIPDWVSDLQKKAPTLDHDISTALAQRVNCLSCLEQKALDRSGLQQSLGVSSLKGIGDFNSHPAIPQCKGTLEENHQIRLIFNRGAVRNNLFSFWDGGSRVFCRLPKSARLCVPSVSEVPSVDLLPQPEETNIYVENTLTVEENSGDMRSKQPDICTKVAADSTCCLQNEAKDGGSASIPDNQSPAPAIFLSPNNADPATAYLRRQQVCPEGHLSYLSTQQNSLLKTGDSPSADEISLPLSDAIQSSPGSIDYANPSLHGEVPAFHLTRPAAQQYSSSDTSNGREQDSQTFVVRKRPALDSMSVVVPPTSPTLFVEGAPSENCPSGLTCDKQSDLSPGPVVNGMMGHREQLMGVHHPKLQHLANAEYVYKIPTGGYQNVIPTFVNGPSADPLSSSSQPSPTASLRPGIPLSNCSDAATNAALRSDSGKPVPSLVNGGESTGLQQMPNPSSMIQRPTEQPILHPCGSKGLSNRLPCTSGSLPTNQPTKVTLSNGFDHDYSHEGALSALLSSRLEARINENIDSVRTAIVKTVRDELLSAYTEAADLIHEVDRLKQEVTHLRGYQAAFYALRPFVSAELWEHLNSQQVRLQLQQHAPSLLPMNPNNGSTVSTVGAAPSSIQPNSPQRVD